MIKGIFTVVTFYQQIGENVKHKFVLHVFLHRNLYYSSDIIKGLSNKKYGKVRYALGIVDTRRRNCNLKK
jgi:hypothetical protein